MFKIDGPDTVATQPAKKPAATQPGWFDGGDPTTGANATMVTRDWLNTIQAELKNVIEGAAIALDRADDAQLLKAILKLVVATVNNSPEIHIDTIPVGTIIQYYHASAAPDGYFPCDGRSFSANAYPKLYALLGKSTVPDMRGCFLRMHKPGITSPLNSKQEDAGRNVTGSWPYGQDGNVNVLYDADGAFNRGEQWRDSGNNLTLINNPANHWYKLDIDASRVWGAAHTANEFRPSNFAVLLCIKHD
jgi:hypothetical protein